MSKIFVHTYAIVVVNNKLINTFDLRRRDVDDATAFAYFVKKQQNYVAYDASNKKLDATFYHSNDKKTFTRLVVVAQNEVATACERCAAVRGAKHEVYCDAEKKAVETAKTAEKSKTAFDLLSTLKKTTAATTSQKSATTAAAKTTTAKKSTADKSKATAAAKATAASDDDDDSSDDDDSDE